MPFAAAVHRAVRRALRWSMPPEMPPRSLAFRCVRRTGVYLDRSAQPVGCCPRWLVLGHGWRNRIRSTLRIGLPLRPWRAGTRRTGATRRVPVHPRVYPTMYTGRPWTMRQYAGFGTAVESKRAVPAASGRRPDRPVRRLRPADPGWATTPTTRWPVVGRWARSASNRFP